MLLKNKTPKKKQIYEKINEKNELLVRKGGNGQDVCPSDKLERTTKTNILNGHVLLALLLMRVPL